MIVVTGAFDFEDEAARQGWIEQAHEAMRVSRSEDGCTEYTIAPDPLNPTRAVLVEEWRDQAALDSHLAALGERRSQAPAPSGPTVAPTKTSIVVHTISEQKRLA
jgi:quinol monooxygenase YgiN